MLLLVVVRVCWDECIEDVDVLAFVVNARTPSAAVVRATAKNRLAFRSYSPNQNTRTPT
jgi:hypothetical protein